MVSPTPTASNSVAALPTDPQSVFALLQTYWRTAYPAAFGTAFAELRGGFQPLDSGLRTGSALCIGSPEQLTGNAYYCPDSDGIAYDTGVLVPVLLQHYGPAGLLSSLAHEFGHAVAARIGVATGPAVVREMQADCFAGNFMRSVAGLDLVAALAPLLDFGDQVTVKPTDPTAHGLAIDRAQSVQLGYRNGPTECRDITVTSISMALGRFEVPADRSARAVAAVDVTAPDRTLAASLGDFALAAAAVREAAAGDSPAVTGCRVGSWTARLFGSVPPDQLGGRLSDPDEALNLLRARPGVTVEELFGFLDGFAGRC